MAFPALPRGAKGWQVEDAVNRILRFLNPGFGADNAGKVLTSNSTGTDLVWADIPYPTLTYLTDALTADVALSTQSAWFTGPSVAQGITGVWLAIGKIVLVDTAGAASVAARLTDGTTVADTGIQFISQANGSVTISLSAIFDTPAGDIHIDGLDGSSTSGKIAYNATSDGVNSTLKVVRIG